MAGITKPGVVDRDLHEYARDENEVPTFKNAGDRNWYRGGISATKWNKAYPYQLQIRKLVGGRYEIADVPGATYTFPIPPESIEVTVPYATVTTITMGGSIEEHNGAPIRMIALSGTFGVAPGRSAGESAKAINFAEAIFAGTISAFNDTRTALTQLTGGSNAQFNVHSEDEFEDELQLGKLTGYYQSRVLQGFLESYAELKKSAVADARLYRLAFCMWKDEAVYLVSPVSLQIRKGVPSPLEYTFALQLKATKRIEPDAVGALEHEYTPVQRDPSKLARLLATAESCRRVLQGARKTIQAVGGDINSKIGGTLREVTLFAKDALSVPLSLADLSDSVIQEAKRAVLDLKSTGNAISYFSNNMESRFDQVSQSIKDEDTSFQALAGELADDPNGADRSSHPANKAFETPEDSYDLFSNIQVGDLKLSPATISKIAEERDRVASMTRLEFEHKRDEIAEGITAFSRALGLSHPTFERTRGLEALPSTAVDAASDEDFEVLFAMNRLLQEMNRLVVTNENEPNHLLDTLATVAGMAERSGIAFRVPRSKFAVPFPYGSTLEMLATRYLGDPNRWHELAVLNGLKAPYIDEEGFTLPLLTNGDGLGVVVGNVTNLFVGQTVWIGSTGATRTRRRVRKIELLAPGQWMVTVDGEPNLDIYATLAEAYLFAFIPHTVNSQQLIYIPSNTEPRDDDFKTSGIPGIDDQDPLIAVGGVDLLLTPTNDLIITPDGDTRWAVGLTNIVQKIRLAASVRQGALNQHPDYGLPIEAGSSIADIEISDLVRSIESMFNGDPSFTGIKAAKIRIDGPVARIAVGVEVRGVDQVIPVAVDVR